MKKTLLTSVGSLLAATLVLGGLSSAAAQPAATAEPTPEIILDDDQATKTGSWTRSQFKPNGWQGWYSTTPKAATATATIRWTPDVGQAGVYGVYYWLPDGGNDRAWDIPLQVHDELGDVGYTIDARPVPGGTWIFLGDHSFAAGTDGYIELTNKAGAVVVADAIKLGAPSGAVDYTVRPDIEKQIIEGIGVEIQSDTIGSGNSGLPDDSPAYIPGDLTESEKQRFYDEMLTGFRYVRLAMGLYLRGVSTDGKNIVERYAGQMDDLRELVEESGIEGANVEYWSPAPHWKDTKSLIRGQLGLAHIEDESEREAWVDEYTDAMMQDIKYLEEHGIPVEQWSLQNEPTALTGYSSAYIDHEEYFDVFKVMAPKIKAYDPDIFIHGDSHHGQDGQGSELIRKDPGEKDANGEYIRRPALEYLDGWSWHRNWNDGAELIANRDTILANTEGKVVFNTEWENLNDVTSESFMMETAHSIMNWMTFMDSPTWYWLHALKPTYNKEAVGYGLGLWRPSDDPIEPGDPFADIQPNHWAPIKTNWHAVAPFVKHLPWNSTRLQVDERQVRANQRIMAWDAPDGSLGLALTNKSSLPYRFKIDLGSNEVLDGHRYDKTAADQALPTKEGRIIQVIVPPNSIEIWNGEPDDAGTPSLSLATLEAADAALTVGETTTTSLSGALADGTAADLSTATVTYASTAPEVAVIDAAGTVTALDAGRAQVSARVELGGATVTTPPLEIEVVSPPPVRASGAPGRPVLSDNSGHSTGLRDGDFVVTTNMWWGDNGSTFRLFENGSLVEERTLTDASPEAQSVAVPIADKGNGTYTYVAELTNVFGTTTSSPHTVHVTDALPATPVLSHDNWDGDGTFELVTSLWWGTNATEYRLFEGEALLDAKSLAAATPSAQRAATLITGATTGAHTYRVELSNAHGTAASAPITVHVTH